MVVEEVDVEVVVSAVEVRIQQSGKEMRSGKRNNWTDMTFPGRGGGGGGFNRAPEGPPAQVLGMRDSPSTYDWTEC